MPSPGGGYPGTWTGTGSRGWNAQPAGGPLRTPGAGPEDCGADICRRGREAQVAQPAGNRDLDAIRYQCATGSLSWRDGIREALWQDRDVYPYIAGPCARCAELRWGIARTCNGARTGTRARRHQSALGLRTHESPVGPARFETNVGYSTFVQLRGYRAGSDGCEEIGGGGKFAAPGE